MTSRLVLYTFLIITHTITAKATCSRDICLSWKISENKLNLKCHVKDVYNLLHFVDPSGRIAGDCTPSIPARCSSLIKNGTIFREKTSNNFVFIIPYFHGKMPVGVWKCFHGTNGERAASEICDGTGKTERLPFREKASTKLGLINLSTELRTVSAKEMTFMPSSTATFGGTGASYSTSIDPNKIRNNVNDNSINMDNVITMYLIPMGAGFAVLLIFSIICNMCVIRKCQTSSYIVPKDEHRDELRELDQEQNIIEENQNIPITDDESDYASVIESELIPENEDIEKGVGNIDNSSISSTHSDNPYLDVVDDSGTSMHYESTCLAPKLDDIHMYCMATSSPKSEIVYINEKLE